MNKEKNELKLMIKKLNELKEKIKKDSLPCSISEDEVPKLVESIETLNLFLSSSVDFIEYYSSLENQ